MFTPALHTESVVEKAAHLLTRMVNWENVLEVAVFGSVAREGTGNDLDVVLVVGHKAYATYISAVWASLHRTGGDVYYDFKTERFEAAMQVLGLPRHEVGLLDIMSYYFDLPIDIHLMPTYWRQDVDDVQGHLPHYDLNFVSNIEAKAISVKKDRRSGNRQIVTSDWHPRHC